MGSNGLTSARHDIFANYLAGKYPESYDGQLPPALVYAGSYGLTDLVENLGITAGKLVLSPTRTYAPVVKEILSAYRPRLHGMIHCSGGGQTKVLHFIDHLHVIKDNLFPVPPLFEMIREESGTSWHDMYQVFNMGSRFEIYTDPDTAAGIGKIAGNFGIEARIIGRCEPSGSRELTISSDKGSFHY